MQSILGLLFTNDQSFDHAKAVFIVVSNIGLSGSLSQIKPVLGRKTATGMTITRPFRSCLHLQIQYRTFWLSFPNQSLLWETTMLEIDHTRSGACLLPRNHQHHQGPWPD
jgi:hypothetical protein